MSQDNEPTFVTDDKAIHKMTKLDETDLEIIKSAKTGEGLITITSVEQFQALAKGLHDTWLHYRMVCDVHMTREQAEFVRKLRVDDGYSWRAVAHACFDQNWPHWERWQPPSSQPMGMALCERAAKFFSEDSKKEPWN